MSTSQRGEVSLEFLLLTGIMLVMFVSMVVVIGMRNQEISNSIKFSDAQKIADRVAAEINTASRVDGYYSEFKLPDKLSGADTYTVDINRELGFVKVNWDIYSRASNIMTANITGSIIPGTNKIRSSEGEVIIES